MSKRSYPKRSKELGTMAVAAGALLLSSCTEQDGFTIADTDKDSRVSQAEFDRFMMEAIYSEVDVDRDKKATFAEWKAANPDADEDKFKAPDADGDGVITPVELKAHFVQQGTLDDLFAKVDADGSGHLSREESVAFKEKMTAQSGTTKMQKLSQAAGE